tara:strand:+ start:1098 stop:1277 length:180 start_codon:yes stop_codon:yes gene_type:complete
MINTVEKNYSDINENDFNYKVTYTSGLIIFVPHNEENRHYQEILLWVAAGNTITDSGGE